MLTPMRLVSALVSEVVSALERTETALGAVDLSVRMLESLRTESASRMAAEMRADGARMALRD